MYGTVARMKARPGKEQEIMKLNREWEQTRPDPAEIGAIATYVFRLDNRSDEYVLVAVFKDRESYHKNANDPEQDRWYRELRELLAADPEWSDGEIIDSKIYAQTMA